MSLSTKAEKVFAFDISEGRIKILYKIIKYNKINNIEAQVANGEELPYMDEIFDYIFGNAILHHMTLDKCLPEIVRVLKPGGRAAFCEPLAHNPLINFIRYVKHYYIEKYIGTDRPLKCSDVSTFKKYFKKVEFRESSFLRDRYLSLVWLDRFFLNFPFLKRYASYATVLLEKKK